MTRETGLFGRACGLDWVGILIVLAPTLPPPPPSRPAGRKRGASCGRALKGGKSELDCALPPKWLQRKTEAHRSISARQQRAYKGLSGLQRIEKPLHQFDGNVPMQAFFPPLKTRPHVAVSPPFRPGGGGEGLGERGGIQRKRNKNVVNSQVDNSSPISHHAQEILQKNEHLTHTGRGLEAKNIQRNAVSPPARSTSLSLRSSP